MREHAMIRKRNSKTTGEIRNRARDAERRPREKCREERENCSEVDTKEHEADKPVRAMLHSG
jgi:hypothetical protein